MKNRLIVAALITSLVGCGKILDSTKYKNWEYVRIENAVPDKNCIYKIQEACGEDGNECLNWHKRRAILFNANTVVITSKDNLEHYSVGPFHAGGGENTSTLADYYDCHSAKNLTPAS